MRTTAVTGRLDLLVRIKNKWFHMNHKTLNARASIQNYIASVGMSWHEAAYVRMAEEQLGIKVQGAYLNLVRKLVLPKAQSKETKAWQNWNPFLRQRLSIPKRLRDESVRDADVYLRLRGHCRKTGYWPKNPNACTKWNRKCVYYDNCRAGVPLRAGNWEPRPLDYVDEQDGRTINISRLNDLATCARLYRNRYELNLVPAEEKKPAADFGTAIHEFFAEWYGNGGNGGNETWTPAFDFDAALARYAAAFPPDHDREAADTETEAYGVELLTQYVERFADEDARTIDEVMGVEVTLETQMEV